MTSPVSPPARALIAVGKGLPGLSFRRIDGAGVVRWTQGTMAPVVFVPHRGQCDDCARYLAELGAAVEGLREWATRAMVLAPGSVTVGPPGVLLLADSDEAGRSQLGVGDDQAALIQADRWGAVYQVETVGPGAADHAILPAARDLVALAQFIDIQCPECGIPSREWLGASPFPLG